MEKYIDKILDYGLSGIIILVISYFVVRVARFLAPLIRDGITSLVEKAKEFLDSMIDLHASMKTNDEKQTQLLEKLDRKVDDGFLSVPCRIASSATMPQGGPQS